MLIEKRCCDSYERLEMMLINLGKDDNFECGNFETSISKASGCPGRVRVEDDLVGKVSLVSKEQFRNPRFQTIF